MKSRAECLQLAVTCEHMAADVEQDADRTVLLATAAHWRTLARQAPDDCSVRNAVRWLDVG